MLLCWEENSRAARSVESRASRKRVYHGRVDQRKVEGNVSSGVQWSRQVEKLTT